MTGSKHRWWHEPLVHFALLTLLLFGLYQWLNPQASLVAPAPEENTAAQIVVNRAVLLDFIAQRSKDFSPESVATKFDRMDSSSLQHLITQYMTEEALVRTALSLGLDTNDYVIRRRLVQKLDFMGQGIGMDQPAPTTEQLADFYHARQEQYRQPATVTFTHIYLNTQSFVTAEALLAQLNQQRVGFNQSGSYGDRFLYQRNYVESTADQIANQFSQPFADRLFDMVPGETWQGPLASLHGLHLVLLTAKQTSRIPSQADAGSALARDYRLHQAQQRHQQFIQDIVAKYSIVLDPDLQQAVQQASQRSPEP